MAHKINPQLTDLRDLDTLHEDPRNARRHPTRNLDAIKASLAGLGQQKPIVIDKKGKIVAGNGTFRAARALGWDKLGVLEFDGTAAQARQFAIADNRTAELAEWETSVLQEEMHALGTDWEPTGFTTDELRDMTGQLPSSSAPASDSAGHNAPSGAADLEHANDDIGKTPDEKLKIFENNAIRQVVLIYPWEQHEGVVAALEAVRKDQGLDTNAQAVVWLLDLYKSAAKGE